MGWTSRAAKYYKNGRVDVKKEVDEMYTSEKTSVIKSTVKSTIYYGAIRIKDDTTDKVVGVVVLTSTRNNDGFNFSYKDMDETMGPCYYDCPKSILKLLSETDSEYAKNWREKCIVYQEHAKKIKKIPEGTIISFASPWDWSSGIKAGDTLVLKKWKNHRTSRYSWLGMTKKCVWTSSGWKEVDEDEYVFNGHSYRIKNIPLDYKIIKEA